MPNLHQQWLDSSREDPSFLTSALEHGFSLHPVKDEPVLIYSKDIKKLEEDTQITKSENCYRMRAAGQTWSSVAKNNSTTTSNAWNLAKGYAERNKLKWPL